MTLSQFLFKNRSYTPIFFFIPLVLYGRPTLLTLIAGFIILLMGESLRFWGVAYAGGETRTTKVGASGLVTQGPFAYIRNPLYAGNLLIYFGISIMDNSLFPYLQIIGVIFFSIQYYLIVKDEETFLRDKFKDKYDDYFNSVPSFFPNFKPYDESKQSKLKSNYKESYRSEKRTFQAISWILVLIVLTYILINA